MERISYFKAADGTPMADVFLTFDPDHEDPLSVAEHCADTMGGAVVAWEHSSDTLNVILEGVTE